jgi:site-specific DNA-methyltransferase (adenine-specific)
VEQQKALMHKLRRRGLSLRTIAGELRLGKSTIAREVSRVPDGTPEKVTGLDGRNYPANRRPSVTVNSARDEERVRLAFQELDGALPTRPTTLARLEKRVKAARVRIGDSPDHSVQGGAGWRIDCTDLREWDLEDNSVDLILTDPPYTNEGLPLYNDLAQFGARVLRPGGLLIAYCGKLHLPDIYDHLFTELEYVWQGIVVQNSRSTRIHVRKMQGGYRPFLICSKGSYVPSRWMYDTITSTKAPEKDLHPWQQSLNPFLELVEMASKRGELICDPFTGSGTTGVAALMLGRSFVGCEIDPRTAKEASARLTTVDETKAET